MYPYSATLFQPHGTIAPPDFRKAPALPPIDLVPDSWEVTARLRGDGVYSAVPGDCVRVIFGHGVTRVAFDFPAADYPRWPNGPDTIAGHRGMKATPADPYFYR